MIKIIGMKEEWKYIIGYNRKYQVSNFGNVKTFHYGGRLLKFGNDTRGYITIALCKNGIGKTFKLHRIVAEAFLKNPLKLKEVNHIDNNKNNNKSSNLEWCTHKENMQHCSKQKRIIVPVGEKNHLSKLTEIEVKLIRKNKFKENYTELGKRFGCSRQNIAGIIKKLTWKHI